MLFVGLLKARAGTEQERAGRRLAWQIPDGIEVKAEYWLQTTDPESIFVFEADSFAAMMQISGEWNDLFDVSIFPAIEAKEGLEMLEQMMG